MYKYLDKIDSPRDLQNLNSEEIRHLAKDIRVFLVQNVSKTGGHLASNLGVVELTLAIHSVFDTSKDKVIFDVGHQSYVHKILTGRKDRFDTLRQLDGLSGFPKTTESIHDAFNTGHSSTSISAGIGMALAKNLTGEDYNVVCLIGDSSLGSGLALEGLNFIGHSKLDMLIILNDNEMSIEKNVGALSRNLSRLRVNNNYRNLSDNVKSVLSSLPYLGDSAVSVVKGLKDGFKNIVVPGALFNELGINYFGPVNGHNYDELVNALVQMKRIKGPKILHVKTIKGRGYKFAQQDPTTYHGVGSFDVSKKIEPSNKESFSDVVGKSLVKIFEQDEKAVAICAAMIKGTGLDCLKQAYPNRVIDVGMEESNAVTIAAGLAISGLKPYVAIYSTFLQRAYDQILHDVCLQNLPVTFLVDRAGVVGEDGETHNGVYDISYFSTMPNIEIYSPKDAIETEKLMLAMQDKNCPVAIRFQKGISYNLGFDKNSDDTASWEIISDKGNSSLLASGKMLSIALNVQQKLKSVYDIKIKVINTRRLRPLDMQAMEKIENDKYIFTMEDGVLPGGLFPEVSMYFVEKKQSPKLYPFGFSNEPIAQGKVEQIYERYDLTPDKIAYKINQIMNLK